MPLKHRKQIFQIYVTDLKIPTGSSQTSWLFTKSDRGFELGTTKKQIPLVREEALNPGPLNYNTSTLNHSDMLPPLPLKKNKHVTLFSSLGLVHIVKNCGVGSDTAQDLGHSSLLHGPTSQQITYRYIIFVYIITQVILAF